MLIRDEATQIRDHAGTKRAEHRQVVTDTIKHETAAEVRDFDTSPTNPMRQWGAAMPTATFEAKLKPILPAFIVMRDHPTNETKRVMYMSLPGGALETLVVYERLISPEHSIMATEFEDVPDMSVEVLDSKDIPKSTFVSPEEGYTFDTTAGPLPGWKRVPSVDVEVYRGWRTVLIRLVQLGVVNGPQVEAIFGADDRKEWAHGLGKSHNPTLWCQ
jgi:hypothetical protein